MQIILKSINYKDGTLIDIGNQSQHFTRFMVIVFKKGAGIELSQLKIENLIFLAKAFGFKDKTEVNEDINKLYRHDELNIIQYMADHQPIYKDFKINKYLLHKLSTICITEYTKGKNKHFHNFWFEHKDANIVDNILKELHPIQICHLNTESADDQQFIYFYIDGSTIEVKLYSEEHADGFEVNINPEFLYIYERMLSIENINKIAKHIGIKPIAITNESSTSFDQIVQAREYLKQFYKDTKKFPIQQYLEHRLRGMCEKEEMDDADGRSPVFTIISDSEKITDVLGIEPISQNHYNNFDNYSLPDGSVITVRKRKLEKKLQVSANFFQKYNHFEYEITLEKNPEIGLSHSFGPEIIALANYLKKATQKIKT